MVICHCDQTHLKRTQNIASHNSTKPTHIVIYITKNEQRHKNQQENWGTTLKLENQLIKATNK